MEHNYNTEQPDGGVPIKMWTRGVPVEEEAKKQLANAARLPIVFKHIAAMPDVHLGIGATVGSVIPTLRAIIPAAVGVDIGCGMMACKTTLHANDLPDNLAQLRAAIERAVPHGSSPRNRGRDQGSWENPPDAVDQVWATLVDEFDVLCELHPRVANRIAFSWPDAKTTDQMLEELLNDRRGGRRGFARAVVRELQRLREFNAQQRVEVGDEPFWDRAARAVGLG